MPSKAFPWTCFANGLSTIGMCVGSYSCFCSLANMLLFLTLLAFCKRSILERRVGCGPGDAVSPRAAKRFSALRREGVVLAESRSSRLFQSRRGDEAASEALNGEDWNGEESNKFWGVLVCVLFQRLRDVVARSETKSSSTRSSHAVKQSRVFPHPRSQHQGHISYLISSLSIISWETRTIPPLLRRRQLGQRPG